MTADDEEPVVFYPVPGALEKRLEQARQRHILDAPARAERARIAELSRRVAGRLYPPAGASHDWYRENCGCGKCLEDGHTDAPECGGVCALLAAHDGKCECHGDNPGEPGTCPA